MKKITIIAACLFFLSSPVFGQISLTKIKEKTKEKISEAGKSEDNSGSSSKTKSTPESKAAMAESPAQQTIEKFRSELSFTRSAVNKDAAAAEDEMLNLKKLLDQIKKEDPNWIEYEKDEAAYLEIKRSYDQQMDKMNRGNRLFDMYNWSSQLKKEPWRYNQSTFSVELAPSKFEKLKSSFEGETLEEGDKKKFDVIEDFYATTIPQIKGLALEEIQSKIDRLSFWRPANRTKPDYLERFDVTLKVETAYNDISTILNLFDFAERLIPNDPELEAAKKDINQLKIDIDSYVGSGQLEKDRETKKAMIFEARRLGKALKVDPKLDAIVKRDVGTKYGVIQKINITDRDWTVIKNDLDIPVKKGMDVEIAVKEEGKCFIIVGMLISDYEGGGKYGPVNFQVSYYSPLEMNCANVNK